MTDDQPQESTTSEIADALTGYLDTQDGHQVRELFETAEPADYWKLPHWRHELRRRGLPIPLLPVTHPLFDVMRSYTATERRAVFGNEVIDAEIAAQESQREADRIPAMEKTLDAAQKRIKSLERQLAQAHQAIDRRLASDQRKRREGHNDN